jgi:hypothetical protein
LGRLFLAAGHSIAAEDCAETIAIGTSGAKAPSKKEALSQRWKRCATQKLFSNCRAGIHFVRFTARLEATPFQGKRRRAVTRRANDH